MKIAEFLSILCGVLWAIDIIVTELNKPHDDALEILIILIILMTVCVAGAKIHGAF